MASSDSVGDESYGSHYPTRGRQLALTPGNARKGAFYVQSTSELLITDDVVYRRVQQSAYYLSSSEGVRRDCYSSPASPTRGYEGSYSRYATATNNFMEQDCGASYATVKARGPSVDSTRGAFYVATFERDGNRARSAVGPMKPDPAPQNRIRPEDFRRSGHTNTSIASDATTKEINEYHPLPSPSASPSPTTLQYDRAINTQANKILTYAPVVYIVTPIPNPSSSPGPIHRYLKANPKSRWECCRTHQRSWPFSNMPKKYVMEPDAERCIDCAHLRCASCERVRE